jgi:hypothetical protein
MPQYGSNGLWAAPVTVGLAANRPTAPTPPAGVFYFYYASDTGTLSLWDPVNAVWTASFTSTAVATASLPTPSAALKGATAFTNDGAATPVFGAIATGGGTLFLPVFCDGTNWRNG